MSFKGTFKGRRIGGALLGLYNLIFGKSSLIQEYPVDWLAHNMASVDILHIDTQGSELLVLEGASNRLRYGLIDYILVGTHAHKLHMKVFEMLEYSYDVIANAEPGRINHHEDMPPVWIAKGQDGLILFKRKGL